MNKRRLAGKTDYGAQEPWVYRKTPIPHYYGDIVRQLLLAAAALMLVSAPFYASNLQVQLPIIVLAALVLVCFAAFTSPRAWRILIADMVIAGVGMALFEIWALSNYQEISLAQTVFRQAIALIFLFAFYFAGKTFRGVLREHIPLEEDLVEMDEQPIEPETSDDLYYEDTDSDSTPDALEESYEYKEK